MGSLINGLWTLATIGACWSGSTRVQLLLLTLFVMEIAIDLKRLHQRRDRPDEPPSDRPSAPRPALVIFNNVDPTGTAARMH
jgi:hypothetical protein